MKELVIKENDSNQRLDKFMQKRFPTMPNALMYKYIRKNCVKINNKKCEAEQVLKSGDILTFFIKEDFFEKKEKIDLVKIKYNFKIIFEDDNIIFMEKPCGLLCQPDDNEKFNTLDNHLRAYLMQKGEYKPENEQSFVPALCNRIDRNTHGIVIGAKNAESLRILNKKIKDREIEKNYLCLVFGNPIPKTAKITAYLRKNAKNNTVEISPVYKKGFYEIVTEYSVIAFKNNISLLDVNLITGKTHQIRAHLAYMGYPLVGDMKYGHAKDNTNLPFKYQALSAYKIKLNFITDSGILNYLNKKQFSIKPFFSEYDIMNNLTK